MKLFLLFFGFLFSTGLFSKDKTLLILPFVSEASLSKEAIIVNEFVHLDFESKSSYKLIKPRNKQAACFELDCGLKAGEKENADYVLTGSLRKLGSSYFLMARLIDIQKKEVVHSNRGEAKTEEELGRASSKLVQNLSHSNQKEEIGDDADNSIKQESFQIKTEPEGAEIWLNYKKQEGLSPKEFTLKRNEEYHIRVKKDGMIRERVIRVKKKQEDISFSFNISETSILWEGEKNFSPNPSPISERFGFSFFQPISINDTGTPKYFQFNMIYGQNRDLFGFGLGGINRNAVPELSDKSTRPSIIRGTQLGFINIGGGELTGLQLSLFNISTKAKAFQLGLIGNWNTEDFTGAQIGLGLSLVSVNKNFGNFSGFQWGTFININEMDFKGMQVGGLMNVNNGEHSGLQMSLLVANMNNGVHRGIQLAPLLNYSKENFEGLMQLSSFNYSAKDSSGLQLGLINRTGANMNGMQFGGVNLAGVSLSLQFGFLNRAESSKGWQLGVINYSKGKAKLQIGILNIAKENRIPILPIVNFDF